MMRGRTDQAPAARSAARYRAAPTLDLASGPDRDRLTEAVRLWWRPHPVGRALLTRRARQRLADLARASSQSKPCLARPATTDPLVRSGTAVPIRTTTAAASWAWPLGLLLRRDRLLGGDHGDFVRCDHAPHES